MSPLNDLSYFRLAVPNKSLKTRLVLLKKKLISLRVIRDMTSYKKCYPLLLRIVCLTQRSKRYKASVKYCIYLNLYKIHTTLLAYIANSFTYNSSILLIQVFKKGL